eukprot:4111214-Ditylum_brightwellii.AAC.1
MNVQNNKAAPHCLFLTMISRHIIPQSGISENLAKGVTQLNAVNNARTKVTVLLVMLPAVHGKDNIHFLAETKQYLEVENFLKGAKEVKYLLDY